MMQFHFPWLLLSIAIPACGAMWLTRIRSSELAQKYAIAIIAATFFCTLGAWVDFASLNVSTANDWGEALTPIFGANLSVVDELSAPLLPLAALLYLLTAVVTMRTKIRQAMFAGNLASLAILLATFSCREPWIIVALLVAGAIPPYWELRVLRKPSSVFALHMCLMAILLVLGMVILTMKSGASDEDMPISSAWAAVPLWLAVFIRCGIVPFHCWMTDLFERASFGTAILHGTPMVGAYVCVRLVLPVTPEWELRLFGFLAMFTSIYAGGMSLVQRDARRFFCYVLLSHSALVLLGLEIATPNSFTGALCVWLSIALALTGFGLSLRAVEARVGRLSLVGFQGLYEQMPTLATFYLLTGLASVGFPGTFGFIGTEMLIDGVVVAYPYVGVAVVFATALTGIAVVKTYFSIFTGARHANTISLRRRPSEKIAVLCLAAIIFGGGLFPQLAVSSRHRATVELIQRNHSETGGPTPPAHAQVLKTPATWFNAANETAEN